MKDPLKIIHKFKNNNRRIQYKVYIFIGSLVPEDILKILNSIRSKNFYDTLVYLSNKQIKLLEDYYGEEWYNKFFISYHVLNQIKIILNNNTKKKEIEKKFGKEWFTKHINPDNIKKIVYSFASTYYQSLLDRKKIEVISKKVDLDFRTLIGGGDDEEEIEEVEGPINEEDLDDIVQEDFDLEEITKMYETEPINDKVIKETSKLISQAINDKKWEKTVDEVDVVYDKKLDNLSYDAILDEVYEKYYIEDEYIFKDDTIKTMRQKIAVSIPLNNNMKLLPELQYFWSEYINVKEKDQVMLGQKWIRRNELLKIDIIPNENLKVYEKLRNNLSYLKDYFGYKIKREDDENNIIRFYDDFMTNNEIYMLDLYNELGINYNVDSESKKNLYDVFVSIYFPFITFERFDSIIKMLNGIKNEKEEKYITNEFIQIKNDTKLENMIYTIVEEAKEKSDKYDKLFDDNYIILANIHVNLSHPNNITGTTTNKFNLYRIFDNFLVNEEYPFIQYHTPDGQVTYKLYTKTDKSENASKWFESTIYGIGFKYLVGENKYVTINLQENGKMEYKITWKEEEKTTMTDLLTTYNYVKNTLKKINSENTKVKFMIPEDERFQYAFINTIQKFTVPEKFIIKHNDLSDFCRFFFPYVALVIEPKKRKAAKEYDNKEETSKYGTYLRYKRTNKYDNRIKMHLRILYFLRNYEVSDRDLIDEISKQFNITSEEAVIELDLVRNKYAKVLKKSSTLKKIKSLPKSIKPQGLSIDIQGKDRERYKIRITGIRSKSQLDEIVSFLKVLIFLYSETYLYKKAQYQKIKDTLKQLNKIAVRRNKVNDIVDYEEETISNVKAFTAFDKKRFGFKPEKGQNQYTRSCQNSGDNKKRRPDITMASDVEKLIKDGYKLNPNTGFYEKEVEINVKKKKQMTTLRAVKLTGENGDYYLTCNPNENKEHIYIGFLTKGNNPNALCMPCCFKKDQMYSNNKFNKSFYLKCIGEKSSGDSGGTGAITDKIYILQDTNKIQDGRFIALPKYLDIFFNQIWENDSKIKNHYLYESKSGYFFKYTVKNDNYYYLAAIANIFDKTIDELKELMINFLNNDKNSIYFTYLNNGYISELFKTKEEYINYIKTSNHLEYDMIGELLSIPNVISKRGLFVYVINKQISSVKKILEKETITEKYFMSCLNNENNYMINENRDYIILIKDEKYYFPIYRVQKDEKKDKKIKLEKYYNYDNMEVINILDELKSYHNKSCDSLALNKISGNSILLTKNIVNIIGEQIKIQYIDDRNKCKYLELKNGLIIPVFPSGISYDYNFKHLKDINKLLLLTECIKELKEINKKLKLDYIPKTVFYDSKNKEKINIISLLLENELIIPIKSQTVNYKDINKLGLSIRFQPLEETVDLAITNIKSIIDNRHISVRTHIYKNESYNIYRLELSLFLENNKDIKEKIINIVTSDNIDINDKKDELRKILFKIIDKKMSKQNMAILVKDLPDLDDYNISNFRDYCKVNKNKESCNKNTHCYWDDVCKFRLTNNMAIDFVNKVIEELVQRSIQYKEIIQEGDYYVSDIVDYNKFTYKENQMIVKSSTFNIDKVIAELFGRENAPIIGRRQIKSKKQDEDGEYPEMIELGKQFIQMVEPNKDSIIRAFVNSFYWINNSLFDTESRNLGYTSDLQSTLTNILKAKIIDYIRNNKQTNKYFEPELNKFRKQSYNTDGKLELYVLSYLFDYRIVVYDNYNNVKYLFMQGDVEVNNKSVKEFTKEEYQNKTIFLKFDYDGSKTIPKNIYSIYYL